MRKAKAGLGRARLKVSQRAKNLAIGKVGFFIGGMYIKCGISIGKMQYIIKIYYF